MSKIRTLIVDDEPVARQGMRRLLKSEPDVAIIGECGDGVQAVEAIATANPELVFLDIQMPELDGFGVVQTLGTDRMPSFIFVTAYDDFALRAFQVHAMDYLLKPVKAPLFRDALDRARNQIRANYPATMSDKFQSLLQGLHDAKRYRRRLVIRSTGKLIVIKVEEVQWFEAQGDYICVHHGGKRHLLRERLTALENSLDPGQFARIHRSAIVKIDCIQEIQPLTNGDYAAILTTGEKLTISRSHRERVFDSIR